MNNKDFKIYLSKIKEEQEISITEDLIEKDYILSLFLSNWAKENTPNLDKLIFKGGTLLTKNYLKYHRISEDLDFIHQDSNIIRKIKTKRIETEIKNRIISIINEIDKIAKISKLDFQNDRNNTKYIIQRNSRSLYIINLYYISQITKKEDKIKFEISFVEDLINLPQREEINNIIDFKIKNLELLKKIINYDLEKPILQIYSIEEIILEKIRATITREQFKPRDVFDLYLIDKKNNIFNQKKEDIFQKLKSSPFEFEKTINNIQNFINEEIIVDLDDIYNLSLIKFDQMDFFNFTNKLIKYLKQIAEEFLENLKDIIEDSKQI